MSFAGRVLNPNFHGRNLVAYNFAGYACIAFVVFLSASQPFYLSDVMGISPEKIGKVTGSLAAVDELTAIVTSPFAGTLNDRLQGYAWKSSGIPSASRILQLAGFTILGMTFFAYGGLASHIVPDLYILRAFFAIGVSSVMGVAVVMLHEASNSDFNWQKLKFWQRKRSADERTLDHLQEEQQISEEANSIGSLDEETLFIEEGAEYYTQKQKRHHGKLSALLGLCTGSGALLALGVFLPLPAQLAASHENWSSADCIKVTYTILGGLSICAGIFVFACGYDCVKQRKLAGSNIEAEGVDATYFQLMKEAVLVSTKSRKVQLAYLGGFIARSTAIATTVFVPLMVFKFYSATGACGSEPDFMKDPGNFGPGGPGGPGGSGDLYARAEAPPQKTECFNAFIFSAILTGVASMMSLILTPVWSILVDAPKLGSSFALFVAASMSTIGCFGLCIAGWSSEIYDPRNAWCFVLLSFVSVAQMGAIIASMSLLSKAGQSLEDSEHRLIGSITGLYNLCGSAGILVIAKLGGTWSDHWVFGPFLILGVLDLVLMGVAAVSIKAIR